MNPPVIARCLWSLCLGPLLLAVPAAQAATPASAAAPVAQSTASASVHDGVFATVNGQPISIQEFEAAFTARLREKFYHGQVPEGQLEVVREEVKNKLVQRILLQEEVERRSIAPDQKQIDDTIAGYESRYAASQQWQENRERLLPGLRAQLGRQNQLSQLEQAVRHVPEPTEAEVRAYYDAHPDLFTEPEKLRLSAILLKVEPSSPVSVWEATREEAKGIHKRLVAGADFAETARLHSNLDSASSGGDMGYLHRGMLGEALQQHIDSYELGKVNEPIDTLDGVAIFRLDDRLSPKKREFADVAQRAKELMIRENQDKAWQGLLDKLVAGASVKINRQPNVERREGSGS